MGIWSASILGNDTSAEVYEVFFERYNRGETIEVIEAVIVNQFAVSLALDEDRHNVLFARALAAWETGTLTAALGAEVVAAVDSGAALAAYRSLGADDAMLRQRSKVLVAFVQKLGTPRPTPKKRKKPPTPLVTRFVPGACLSFRRSDQEYGGVVVIDSEFFTRRGEMLVAATDLAQHQAPTFADFTRSRLHDFSWEPVSGQAARLASSNGKAGGIGTRSLDYDSNAARVAFFDRADRFFEVVGHLPRFTQVLLGTTSTSVGASDDALRKVLDRDRADGRRRVSREPLETLAALLKHPTAGALEADENRSAMGGRLIGDGSVGTLPE